MERKIIILSFFAVAVLIQLRAQELPQYAIEVKDVTALQIPVNNSRVNLDTLGWNEFLSLTTQVWSLGWASGGYVFGTSGPLGGSVILNTFAQGYINEFSQNIGVVGAWIWVSDIDIKSSNPCNIQVSVRLLDGQSAYTVGGTPYNITCPGPTPLASGSFNITDVDTSWSGAMGLIGVDFTSTALIQPGQDFAIVFNASQCSQVGDTIGVIASDEGVADQLYGREYTFIFYPALNNYALYDHLVQGGMSRMPALFAIVDKDFVNIDDIDFFYGMQLTLFPNPASDQLTISFGLKEASKTRIEVLDMKGQYVYRSSDEMLPAGVYHHTVDVSNLAAGSYLVCVVNEKGRLTKKLIIE